MKSAGNVSRLDRTAGALAGTALMLASRERGAPRRMRGGAARSNLQAPVHAGEGAGGPV
jgi:hypothetical protein